MRLILLGLLLGACDDIQKTDHFSVEVSTGVVLAAATPEQPTLEAFPELPGLTAFDLGATDAFESRGYLPEDADHVELVAATLTATGPEGAHLGFLGRVRLYVEADGQPRRLVAQSLPIEGAPRQVFLSVAQGDLTPWLVGTPGRMVLEPLDAVRPGVATHVELRLLFEVDVKVL